MGLFPYLDFTRLLRDVSRGGIERYAGSLASAIAAWEGVEVSALKFQPRDPMRHWWPPAEKTRSIACRYAASDTKRRWYLTLQRDGVPRVTGALFADDPSEWLDEAADWRGYGDHLIESGVADTAGNIVDFAQVRGLASGILLVTRLEALAKSLSRPVSASATSALIRVLEEVPYGGSPRPRILTVSEEDQEMKRFLAQRNAEILERVGGAELTRVLAPLGLTLRQWREAV